ncbi:hypothetical protein QJS66_10575 [Kocuria rhizophila]|nr:hypothetical protein QJS66_10575 [Kocuria rhizophila]
MIEDVRRAFPDSLFAAETLDAVHTDHGWARTTGDPDIAEAPVTTLAPAPGRRTARQAGRRRAGRLEAVRDVVAGRLASQASRGRPPRSWRWASAGSPRPAHPRTIRRRAGHLPPRGDGVRGRAQRPRDAHLGRAGLRHGRRAPGRRRRRGAHRTGVHRGCA